MNKKMMENLLGAKNMTIVKSTLSGFRVGGNI
jgi:hypothetical protein